ncbi:MAG TPA: signal peptidase II [Candidatus Limnocylindria bacterium]
MSAKRIGLIGGVAVLVFILDQLTKRWVEQSIPLYQARPVVGEYVRIVHTENTGAAMGLLPERTTLLSVLSVFAVFAILYYYRQIASSSPLVAATLGMQLGGAFGNLVDRVGQGYVVDWIDVGIPGGWRFWAFNVADSSIVVGIVVVSLLLWLEEQKAQTRPA